MKHLLSFLIVSVVGSKAGICPNGYYYREDSGCNQCYYCSGTCDDFVGCSECYEGFYSNNGSCGLCDHCDRNHCLENGNCDYCSYGYASVNGKCESMANCYAYSYKDGIGCFNCLNGYFGPTCRECSKNCKNWNNQIGCKLCNEGYYLKEGVCKNCGIGCLNCKNETGCQETSENYIIIDEESQLKQDICLEYDLINETGCIRCENGYFTSCGMCIQEKNCLNKVEGKYCITCEDGYELKKGICEECPHNYFSYNNKCFNSYNCNETKNGTGCISCVENYQLVEIKPYFCMLCGMNCISCHGYFYYCDNCEDGFYVKNGTCDFCRTGCLHCIDRDNCTVCKEGFIAKEGLCCDLKCGANCSCNACDEQGLCYNCEFGYYTNNGTCLKCPEHCTDCYSGEKCSLCESGYYLTSTTKMCKKNNFLKYIIIGFICVMAVMFFLMLGSVIVFFVLKKRRSGYSKSI